MLGEEMSFDNFFVCIPEFLKSRYLKIMENVLKKIKAEIVYGIIPFNLCLTSVLVGIIFNIRRDASWVLWSCGPSHEDCTSKIYSIPDLIRYNF